MPQRDVMTAERGLASISLAIKRNEWTLEGMEFLWMRRQRGALQILWATRSGHTAAWRQRPESGQAGHKIIRTWRKQWELKGKGDTVAPEYRCLICLSEYFDTWFLCYGLKLSVKHLTAWRYWRSLVTFFAKVNSPLYREATIYFPAGFSMNSFGISFPSKQLL